ncbi:hypothetical protein V6N11_056098 [Hibiscus sabdariffa]|uniref:Flavodoxin-like domain-containing protein n=1 Tax=Hibiscus sabdariffa TaxID=183260 RepID=A0ABR2T2V8_9ROSI
MLTWMTTHGCNCRALLPRVRDSHRAERRACNVVIRSTDEYDDSSLLVEDTVIFVVSTTSEGDTPDSMKVFWRFLL